MRKKHYIVWRGNWECFGRAVTITDLKAESGELREVDLAVHVGVQVLEHVSRFLWVRRGKQTREQSRPTLVSLDVGAAEQLERSEGENDWTPQVSRSLVADY